MSPSVFDQMQSGVMMTNVEGVVTYVNPAMADMCGYRSEEMTGQPASFLSSGTIPAEVYREMWEHLSRGQPWKGEFCNRRKDGMLYWEHQVILPQRDETGEVTHFVAFKEDITKHRHEELIKQAMIDASGDAYFVLDAKGCVLEWGTSSETLLGYDDGAMVGQQLAQRVFDEDTGKDFDAELSSFLATGRCSLFGKPMRLQMRNVGGMLIPIELSIRSVALDDDWRFVCFVRDIRHVLQGEQQLIQAQKMEAIGQMTGGIAHDFNNLLGIIAGSLDLLAGVIPVSADKYLNIAKDAARRASDVTKALMAVARKRPAATALCDIRTALLEVDPLLRQTAGKKITCEIVVAHDLEPVNLDVTGLNTALLNLVVNARDAMPNGGKLMIYAYKFEVNKEFGEAVSGLPPGHYVLLGVDDTGEGMPEEVAKHAFEPFFTTKDLGKGTGLGLAMVYGFCKQSGGEAVIKSERGRGCSIQMMLPSKALN